MIVLDASAAVAIVRDTEEGKAILGLASEGEAIIAPYLFISEVANSLWKYVRAGEMEASHAATKAQEAYEYVDEYVQDFELMPEALLEASNSGHSAYDVFYLVLARRRKATLFTRDQKLMQMCDAAGVDCIHLVDFPLNDTLDDKLNDPLGDATWSFRT